MKQYIALMLFLSGMLTACGGDYPGHHNNPPKSSKSKSSSLASSVSSVAQSSAIQSSLSTSAISSAQSASSLDLSSSSQNSSEQTSSLLSSSSSFLSSSSQSSETSISSVSSSSSAPSTVAGAFDLADGWASVGVNNLGYAGTTGGLTADVAHTYTVTNRNELINALYTNASINEDGTFSGTLDNTAKIIFIQGTINLNMNKNLVEKTEADYICPIDGTNIKVNYDFESYKNTYDPNGPWGSVAPSGDLETARVCAANRQKAVIQIKIGSNTTIIGKGDDAKIVRGHVRLSPPNDNIIIRNVHFEDSFDMFPQWDPTDSGGRWNSAYDNISVEGATHVWIDHCSFSDGANLDKLYPPVFAAPFNLPEMKVQHHDGAIDVTKNSNYVTLSYNHIFNHDKTHLVGSSDTIASDNGPKFLKLTMHHNYFKDVTQRLPRVRMGQVHLYNNYYQGQIKPISSDKSYAFSVGMGVGQFSKIYAENNAFDLAAATDSTPATINNLVSVSFKQDNNTINTCINAGNSAAECSTLFYESGTSLNGSAVDLMAAAITIATNQTLTLNNAQNLWKPVDFYPYNLEATSGLAATTTAQSGAGKCSACTNIDTKPVVTPVVTSSSSQASSVSSQSSSSASSLVPIPMNCGPDIYMCDDFSAGNSNNWNIQSGPTGSFDFLTQNNNTMWRFTAGSAGGVLALVKPEAFTQVTSGDYFVEARIRPRNNSTTGNKQLYLIARAQDALNWYGAGLNVQGSTASTRVAIGKMVSGVFTDNLYSRFNTPIEQGTTGGTDGVWYTVRLEMKGNNLVVYLNGQAVISGNTDLSFGGVNPGLIGLYTTNKSFEIDDVKVGNPDIKPVQLTLSPSITSYAAEAGDAATLVTVTAKNAAGAVDSYTADSSNPAVVATSINGSQLSLISVGAGTATITITSGSDPTKNHSITATIAPAFVMPTETYSLSGRVDPAVNETNAYTDTRLSITFDSPPTLGTSGRIRIFKLNDDSIVDTISLNANTDAIGYPGQGTYRIVNTSPLSISGNTLTISLDNSKLAYDTSYYVAIADGVVTGTQLNGTSFVGLGKNAGWTFKTKMAAPSGLNVTVDDTGTADFRSVQGALNYVMQAADKTTPATIDIKNGDYRELLFLRGRNNVTLQGESRDGVVIHYKNNELLNGGTGSSQSAGSPAGGRSVFLIESADLLKLDRLTLKNDTLIGNGSQAEVIYFNSDTGRLIATDTNFISEQDTIQVKGYSWFYRSLIAGNVDFIWGNNRVALFEESEIRTLGDSRGNGSGGYILQARTVSAADKGFVFLNSTLTRGLGPLAHSVADNTTWLARSGGSPTFFDNIVFVNTKMDSHIKPEGWNTSPLPNPVSASATSGWREYGSMDLNGTSLNTNARVAGNSYQLSLGEIDGYCSRQKVFAAYNSSAGWNPLPSDSTDCLNFGVSSSSSVSSASSSSSSSANSNSASSDNSSNQSNSSSESSSSQSSSSESSSSVSSSSSSSSSVYVSTTTSWVPNYTDLQALVASNPVANASSNFNATAAPVTAAGLKFYSATAGSLRLFLNSAGTAYAINFNGTAVKLDSNTNLIELIEGTSGQVNPLLLNVDGGVTRFVSVPLVASSNPVTLSLQFTNSSTCTAGQIAIVDNNGKAWKVAPSCVGSTLTSISTTVQDPTVTELYVLMVRRTDAGGGIRIWQIDVTK
jgi:pectate lyase